jgi:fucose permease
MNCASLGAAAIPSLIGILAQNISLESIPACLIVFYLILFGIFLLSIRLPKTAAKEAQRATFFYATSGMISRK